MTKFKKKGFTIVELVIVIAVIAILAAVLIPTFSNIIKKANLSADKQAVREMNSALAEWEALHGYSSKPADVESAMNILEEAGFNAENWVCLTADYQVWWSKTKNRCVLYNSRTAEVEYPEEYKTTDLLNAANGWYIYNANHITAQQFQLSLGSAEGATSQTSFSNVVSKNSPTDVVSTTEVKTQINDKMNTLITSNTSDVKKSILGSNDTSGSVHVFATKEKVSSVSGTTENGAYASLNVASVSATTEAVTLKDSVSGEDKLAENFYFLTIVKTGTPTTTDLAKASQAAGQMLYNIFDQVTTKKIPDEITIVIDTDDEPLTLDVSACEWAPCKTFSGCFVASNPENPIIIDGARLTSATGYSQTVQFAGSTNESKDGLKLEKYFVTGFFGTVYGETTISNVKFTNLTIENPAVDAAKYFEAGKTWRHTVGIIGGVTDNSNGTDMKVVIRNVEVDSTCTVKGIGLAGGLIGYVGAASDTGRTNGYLLIDNCTINTNVISSDTTTSMMYGCVGGVIAYCLRTCSDNSVSDGHLSSECAGFDSKYITQYNRLYSSNTVTGRKYYTNIIIKDCRVGVNLTGNTYMGAAIGSCQAGNIIFEGSNDFSSTTFTKSTGNAKTSSIGCMSAAVAQFSFLSIPIITEGTDYIIQGKVDPNTLPVQGKMYGTFNFDDNTKVYDIDVTYNAARIIADFNDTTNNIFRKTTTN